MRKSLKVGAALGGGAALVVATGAYLFPNSSGESTEAQPESASCKITESPQLLGKVILQARTPDQIKDGHPNPNKLVSLTSLVKTGDRSTEYIVVHGLGFSAEPGVSRAEITAVNQYDAQKERSVGNMVLGLRAITGIPTAKISTGALIETPVSGNDTPTYTSTLSFSGGYEVDVYGISIAQEQQDAMTASSLAFLYDCLG